MDRVFSVGEISDQFWSPQPPPSAVDDSSKMNRSASEWAFQRFLQEASASSASDPSSSGERSDVLEVKNSHNLAQDPNPDLIPKRSTNTDKAATTSCDVTSPSVPADPEQYQALLKSKLNLACAAVAMSRASFVKSQDSAMLADAGSQVSNSSKLGTQPPKGAVHDLSAQDKDASGPLGIPSLPVMQKNSGTPTRQTTSGSSRELSDDDIIDGETETTENMDPADVKRVRR